MNQNKDRMNHFGKYRSKTPDDVGFKLSIDFNKKNLEDNPKKQKDINANFKKASSILLTQSKNGIGCLQDQELRFFHSEFNSRLWEYGFGAMPASFNILEGFFRWDPKLFYLELLEEEEHIFSLFDYIDFVTSKDCTGSIDYFIENVKDELIYSYNILNEVKEITFSTNDSKVYVIGGVSFVKRGNEVFMLLVAGELGDTKQLSKTLPDLSLGIKIKSYISAAEHRKQEAVNLFNKDEIWKVNVYVKIDLERKNIDSKYIQKDTGNAFITITNDYGMLKRSIKDHEAIEELILSQSKEIDNYDSVFEAAYNCLFLPEYFNFYDNSVLPEEHPTGLHTENYRGQKLKNKLNFNECYFKKIKDVWVLDRNIDPISGTNIIKKTELKIEKGGYWEILDPSKVGTDKNGKEIHGKTWVEKTLSWHESNLIDNEVKITFTNSVSQKKGYIYILRNAAHDLDVFKIGLTTKPVEVRAKQLSGTSSPDHFLIVNRWHVQDCNLAENLIHEKLKSFRFNTNREFFKIKLEDAIKEIIPIIEEINKEISIE